MSKSYKKTPVFGNAKAESDKSYKQIEHRRERREVRQILHSTTEPDAIETPNSKKFGSPNKSNKDGKHYFQNRTEKDMRK
jgi:hypothetical protein